MNPTNPMNPMNSVEAVDLASRLSVQAEKSEERWANPQDTESDPETVLDGEMEMVYPDDQMGNQA